MIWKFWWAVYMCTWRCIHRQCWMSSGAVFLGKMWSCVHLYFAKLHDVVVSIYWLRCFCLIEWQTCWFLSIYCKFRRLDMQLQAWCFATWMVVYHWYYHSMLPWVGACEKFASHDSMYHSKHERHAPLMILFCTQLFQLKQMEIFIHVVWNKER